MISCIEPGGVFYISFPIGLDDEVHFNAHRVFHPLTILKYEIIKNKMKLQRFDYVDDNKNFVSGSLPFDIVGKIKWGLGIYTFNKLKA